MHDSGAPRREIAKSYVELEQRHCERSEAIHLATQRKNGLLRFARNDGFTTETSWLFEILKPVCVCVCEALLSLLHKMHPSCPDLIRASINLRNNFFEA